MATDINILTGVLRQEFLNSLGGIGKPAPTDNIVTVVSSKVRIERYPYMTPTPGFQRFKGYRRPATLSSIVYSITNEPWDASMVVPLRDLKDDVVGAYKRRMGDMMAKSKEPFRSRIIMQQLAAGETGVCFDGSYFHAATHNIGGYPASVPGATGGGNLYTVTTAAVADGLTHTMVVNVKNTELSPLIYQVRDEPKFITDAGTPQSEIADRALYVVHLEAAAGYGYWHDSVKIKFLGTPTYTEALGGLDVARQALRRFSYPISLPTDPVEYVHEQMVWAPDTVTVVNSVGLETILTKVLNENSYGISPAGSTAGFESNNVYFKKFTQITTNALN